MFQIVVPPRGGRIYGSRVLYDPSRSWKEAIDAAGPDTLGEEIPIRSPQVGEQYPAESGSPREMNFLLVNFGCKMKSVIQALRWAEQFPISAKKPREIFAIGEHSNLLHSELGLTEMAVISLCPFVFENTHYLPTVEWIGYGRGVGMVRLEHQLDERAWFAFGLKL